MNNRDAFLGGVAWVANHLLTAADRVGQERRDANNRIVRSAQIHFARMLTAVANAMTDEAEKAAKHMFP